MLHHYNTPGDAHELTFSCYRRQTFFNDSVACHMFLDELNKSRGIYDFKLWAYVLMPHHVHLLIWPLDHNISGGVAMVICLCKVTQGRGNSG
jgi:REP element-mobilizing transposase RayT